MICGKASLPWITQEIRRLIRKRDVYIYRSYKKIGDPKKRSHFLQLRKHIKFKIKLSYETYIEGLLDKNSVCDSKKLFSFLKNSRQDHKGSPPLKQSSKLITEPCQKANIQNQQFQYVLGHNHSYLSHG